MHPASMKVASFVSNAGIAIGPVRVVQTAPSPGVASPGVAATARGLAWWLVLIATQFATSSSHAQSLPWSADPELASRLSQSRPLTNYHEDQVPPVNLPDPLVDQSGQPITTARQWTDHGRDEVLEWFRDHVYGRRPSGSVNVRYQVAGQRTLFDGRVDATQWNVVMARGDQTFSFPFVIYRKSGDESVSPAIIHINNRSSVSIDAAEDSSLEFFPIVELTNRGYHAVTFFTSDVDPDRADGYAEGVRSFLADGNAPSATDWRSLSAWGWAASRILDHLESDAQVDASRVAVIGHSRGGKAALWAAAEDERFAVAYSNQSGCGGAALSRRCFGERIRDITKNFPHWFAPGFAAYLDRENEMPVDQHQLISLIAPRSVFVGSAGGDLWADPRGEYLALVNASPIFRLFGHDAITRTEMPAAEETRIRGATGYRVRNGKHDLNRSDWNAFLRFADPKLQPAG